MAILSRGSSARDDQSKIVFVSDRDGNDEIYSMNADGSNVVRLTNDPAKDESPCWSPDGTQIAFASNRSGKWDIWRMDADGTNQVNVTNDKDKQDTDPMWATSESSIAFISNRKIYTIKPDGTNLYLRNEIVTAPDCQPSVSPLALRIAMRNVQGKLLVSEGTDVFQVVPMTYGSNGVPAQVFHPSWSSDGQDIAFDSGGPTPKLFTVDLTDGTCDPILMDGNGFEPVFIDQNTSVVFTSPTGVGAGSDICKISLDAASRSHGLPKPDNLTHMTGNDKAPAVWEKPSY